MKRRRSGEEGVMLVAGEKRGETVGMVHYNQCDGVL
jgi:hypothetical protein